MPAVLAPRLWVGHLLALVCVAAAVLLGLWQLDAWQARRADEARDLTRAEPVPLSRRAGARRPVPGPVGRPAGRRSPAPGWPTGTVFVSGREHDGRGRLLDGHPARVGGPDAPALPVVLGWVADPTSAPAPPEGSAELVGWLQPPEGTGARDDDPSDDVLPQLRIADLVQHVDQDLYGAYAVAAGTASPGCRRPTSSQLPDAGRFTAVRNLLYAIEWWVFGAFAVLIWWRWVGEQLARTRTRWPQEDEDQPDTVTT